jgi:hypothetical protein
VGAIWGDSANAETLKLAGVERCRLVAICVPDESTCMLTTAAVRKLNEVGGEFPAWSGDGRKVMWGLGNAVWTFDLDRAKVVDDSLKVEARRVALVRADTTKKDSLARADSIAKADTTKKEKPGYKPAEQRIAVSATRERAQGTVVFRGAKAITMRGHEIIENADIVVRDDRIVAIGARGTVTVPAGARDDVAARVMPAWSTPLSDGSRRACTTRSPGSISRRSPTARRRRATRRRRRPTSSRTATASPRAR